MSPRWVVGFAFLGEGLGVADGIVDATVGEGTCAAVAAAAGEGTVGPVAGVTLLSFSTPRSRRFRRREEFGVDGIEVRGGEISGESVAGWGIGGSLARAGDDGGCWVVEEAPSNCCNGVRGCEEVDFGKMLPLGELTRDNGNGADGESLDIRERCLGAGEDTIVGSSFRVVDCVGGSEMILDGVSEISCGRSGVGFVLDWIGNCGNFTTGVGKFAAVLGDDIGGTV